MKGKIFTDNDIKIIAILTMIVDHVGTMFFPEILMFRIIGRIAFPLFVFMIVQGYFRTSNFKKYCLRLIVLGLISEVPFDLFNHGTVFSLESQNVCFTLLLCLLFIKAFDSNKEKSVRIMLILGFSIVSIITRVDYFFLGILYTMVFYFDQTMKLKPLKQGLLFFSYSLLYSLILIVQPLATASLIFTTNYNSIKTENQTAISKFLNINKKYYYISYPVQFLLLIILKILI
jgi:hypothetical protein